MSDESNPGNHSTRFQPGRSGNPAGRPKGRMKQTRTVDDFLEEKVVTKSNDRKSRRISRVDALLETLFRRAITGDIRAAQLLIRKSALPAKANTKAQIKAALDAHIEKQAYEEQINAQIVRDRIDQMVRNLEENKRG